jgi:transposase
VLLAVQKEVTTSGRTWNADQIADFIAVRFGIKRSANQVRRKLRQAHMSYKRTGRHLHHKQKPQEVAAKTAELAVLEKGGSQAS